nr:two-component sensor histidine kinase [Geotalea toluenoxydans]
MDQAEKQQVEELRKQVLSLEKQLEERTLQLQEAQQELGSLNYAISHDLRSPLRNIFGFAHLLSKKYGDRLQGQGLEYLEMIMSGVARMGRMIDDLLTLSRIGRLEMKKETVDLSAMATAILQELQESQPERQTQVEVAPEIKVIGDRQLLQAALRNLLDNAWKFTKDAQPAIIRFGSRQEGDRTIYFVQDNGAGFAADQLYRLFNLSSGFTWNPSFPAPAWASPSSKKQFSVMAAGCLPKGQKEKVLPFTLPLVIPEKPCTTGKICPNMRRLPRQDTVLPSALHLQRCLSDWRSIPAWQGIPFFHILCGHYRHSVFCRSRTITDRNSPQFRQCGLAFHRTENIPVFKLDHPSGRKHRLSVCLSADHRHRAYLPEIAGHGRGQRPGGRTPPQAGRRGDCRKAKSGTGIASDL